MKLIYIEKVAAVDGGLPPIPKGKHEPGTYQGEDYSLPVEYNVEGYLFESIEVGKTVIVSRTKRNGVEADGFWQSTKVVEMGEGYFKTKNSVYKYKFL